MALCAMLALHAASPHIATMLRAVTVVGCAHQDWALLMVATLCKLLSLHPMLSPSLSSTIRKLVTAYPSILSPEELTAMTQSFVTSTQSSHICALTSAALVQTHITSKPNAAQASLHAIPQPTDRSAAVARGIALADAGRGWHAFALAQRASAVGAHTTAATLYRRLQSDVFSEHTLAYLSALEQLAMGEADPVAAAPCFLSALSLFRSARTPTTDFSFQCAFIECRVGEL